MVILVVMSSTSVLAVDENILQSSQGAVGSLRGGFGVKAPISNYQLAWGNRPLTWTISIEGDFVLFGHSSGTVAAMGQGTARSSLIPPAFGFGAVTVTLTVLSQGSTVEKITRSGHMIGPFIILI